MNNFKRFTDQEREFIRKNLHMTNAQIGGAIGRTEASISWQIAQMKLSRGKKKWSREELTKLKQVAPGKSRCELAALFGVSENQITACLKNNKIKTGRDTKIKPGSVPPNKGKKLSPDKITDAMRANWFRKGHSPHNTLNDGDIITKNPSKGNPISYKFIRLGPKKWEVLHRYNYKKYIGPIPAGSMVTFKDGNPLNCDPSNLKLESSVEHMQRNTIMRFDPQLRSVINLLSNYKRKLKKYEEQNRRSA